MAFSPFLADSDIPGIITVIAVFLSGLYWLFRKLAESKDRQRQIAERERIGETEEEEGDESYIADEHEVQRFLETLGVEAEPRPEPPRRPQPTQPPMPPPAQPGQPPQRPPRRPLQPEPEPLLLEPPPPRPAPPRRRPARQLQPAEPEETYTFGAGPTALALAGKRLVADAEQEPARKTTSLADRLAFPHLAPLQRAIILSDILGGRPGPHRHGRR